MTDTWTWATVTQASPLRIKVDGDTTPLDATTDDLVGSLAVDDRVRVHLHSDGIIVTGIQGGGNRSNPNLLINSDFMVNQRGAVSGADVAVDAHFLDRWRNSGGVANTGFRWADLGGIRTLTIGAIGYTRQCAQVIEKSSVIAGAHTLSWSGTAQARVYNSGASAPSFATSPISVNLDGTANVLVELQGSGGTVSNIKLERGPVATPYQPPTYDDNLRACMRYFQRLGGSDPYEPFAPCYGRSTTRAQPVIFLPVPLRAAPTVTWGGTLRIEGTSVTKTATAITLARAGRTVIRLNADTTGLTVNDPYTLLADNTTSAYIAFDAEL